MLGVSNALPVISGVTNYSRHQIRVKLSLLLRLEEKLCTFSSRPMIPVRRVFRDRRRHDENISSQVALETQ